MFKLKLKQVVPLAILFFLATSCSVNIDVTTGGVNIPGVTPPITPLPPESTIETPEFNAFGIQESTTNGYSVKASMGELTSVSNSGTYSIKPAWIVE